MNKKTLIIIGILIVIFIIIVVAIAVNNKSTDKSIEDVISSAGNKDTSTDSIKSFNETASEYNMTPEELERAIEQGLSPEDFK